MSKTATPTAHTTNAPAKASLGGWQITCKDCPWEAFGTSRDQVRKSATLHRGATVKGTQADGPNTDAASKALAKAIAPRKGGKSKAARGSEINKRQTPVAGTNAAARAATEQRVKAQGSKAPAKKAAATEPKAKRLGSVRTFVKRGGINRTTGAVVRCVDLDHPKADTIDGHAKLRENGRYLVQCLTHKAHQVVQDMTAGKPTTAKPEDWCGKCTILANKGEKAPAPSDDLIKQAKVNAR